MQLKRYGVSLLFCLAMLAHVQAGIVLPDLLGDCRGEERMLYDGQLEPSMQLGQNASVRPVELPLRVKTPFPVYLDANGMEMLENTFSGREMPEAEE